jgi:RNA ligase (TIGR02306 family)
VTDFHVECVRVGKIEKHPNADTLGITQVGAYQVIVKLDGLKEGDLAVYVPVDSVVPNGPPEWAFLEGHTRIKAKRLRKIFSQGLLIPAPLGCVEGDDCAALLGITRYETPEERAERGPNAQQGPKQQRSPSFLPRYTDLENIRRWPNALKPGEEVVVMEKLEGENCRVAYVRAPWWRRWFLREKGNLVVGSRNQIKTSGKWVDVTSWLKKVFERQPDPERYSLYGESYGYTAGFPYEGIDFRVFDIWDRKEKRWLSWDELVNVACDDFMVRLAPVLWDGPWSPELLKLADGESVLGKHIREGFVVRPIEERREPGLGRVILKCKGEQYLLRKDS